MWSRHVFPRRPVGTGPGNSGRVDEIEIDLECVGLKGVASFGDAYADGDGGAFEEWERCGITEHSDPLRVPPTEQEIPRSLGDGLESFLDRVDEYRDPRVDPRKR